MNLDEFQAQSMKSVAIIEKGIAAMAHRAFGVTAAGGEIAKLLKKIIRDRGGQPTEEDIAKMRDLLGDNLYYIAVLAEYFDLQLSDIAAQNIDKSKKFKASREV